MTESVGDILDPDIATATYVVCGFITFFCKLLSLRHTFKFAPQNRPINWLNVIDQVRLLIMQIKKVKR